MKMRLTVDWCTYFVPKLGTVILFSRMFLVKTSKQSGIKRLVLHEWSKFKTKTPQSIQRGKVIFFNGTPLK